MSHRMFKHLLDSLDQNRESVMGRSEVNNSPAMIEPEPAPSSGEVETPKFRRYTLPSPYKPHTPVWAVNYDHSRLIHSPSFLSFQNHTDVGGFPIRTLPLLNDLQNTKKVIMNSNGGPQERVRRLPNYVQVADAYIFQQTIDERLRRIGVTQAREDSMRIAGVQYIDQVRRALKLPIRTFDTACMYFHKFRLVHSDSEYSYMEAAAAALFSACKIEDTLKKSRDILCAAHNLKVPRQDQLSPDDPYFESTSRTIIGLERLMLEAAGFDFRSRHPQSLLIKILKFFGHEKDSPISQNAFKISIDLYRTFAPLKQSTAALAFSCLELAERIGGSWGDRKASSIEKEYVRWSITRPMVMETLLDLLDLYNTNYRSHTALSSVPLDTFLAVRIPLNEEVDARHLPRYTEYIDTHPPSHPATGSYTNGTSKIPNGLHSVPPRGPSGSKHTSPQNQLTSPSTNSSGAPGSGSTNATSHSTSNAERPPGNAGVAGRDQAGIRQRIGERGREGTVRFLLNPDREREERAVRAEYGDEGGG